jgi:predicted ATPase
MSVVTFLFTDIEGSTRRWEADPDAMRAALEAHNKVLRGSVEADDGKVFNYTGDGMCAVFASPRSAVDAAIAAQRELELPVRMGIATGEAELRGEDYYGTVLNRTARVMAAGHGGQILLDGITAGLLSGVDLIPLGFRRLRDIAKPVEVFQVCAPGVQTEFPPLKTADPTPGNLRLATTSFIGRENDLLDLEATLKAHQLVTLTGVGGVGKTRLALELAARSANDFPDGVWVVELASVGDPAAVPDAVAAVLGTIQQPRMSLTDSIATALEGRSRLLVLDNCEHVLDAAAELIETILSCSSTVKVLTTSREGLRLADEHLWPVPSLDVATGTEPAAATLFVDRARAVASAISLSKSNDAAAVLEICRRLDGIPLGIELAASRLQSMTVTEVRDRLHDRFRLLVGSRRGLERHQTLRHAVQWSYELLDDTEKALLTRCSVFAGGFDLAAACAVAGTDDDLVTLDLLDALVRKSLVVADRSSTKTRFSMLETIRQFAEDQLVASGEAEDARAAHARYFAGREVDVMAVWDSPRQRETYEWFSIELANLRAAFRWAADRRDLDTAAAIGCYSTFVGVWVAQLEPVAWAEELIAPANAVGHRRLAQLYVMAAQCYLAGRVEDFVDYSDAARAAIEGGLFDKVPHEFEATIGGAYWTVGQPDTSIEWCRKLIARGPGTHIYARLYLVLAFTIANKYEDAVAASEGLLADTEATDNPNTKCSALLAYGHALRAADPAGAYDILRRALKIAQESGNRTIESGIAVSLSRLTATRGDPIDAFNFLTMSIRQYYDSGTISLLRNAVAVLAILLDRLGQCAPAATICGFGSNSATRAAIPELNTAIAHLREVLGDQHFESLVREGAAMTHGALVTYAFEQIDRARAQLPPMDDR